MTLSNIHLFTLMLISAFIFQLFMSSDTNTDADIHWTRFLLTVLDKQWHTECVRCHTCGDLLDHKCFFRSRLPLFKLITRDARPPGKRAAPPWKKSGGKIDLNSERKPNSNKCKSLIRCGCFVFHRMDWRSPCQVLTHLENLARGRQDHLLCPYLLTSGH